MNQNGYINWTGDGRFCVGIEGNLECPHRIQITASCGEQGRRGVHHYSRWEGLTAEQAGLLGKTLLNAAEEVEGESAYVYDSEQDI